MVKTVSVLAPFSEHDYWPLLLIYPLHGVAGLLMRTILDWKVS